MNKRRKLIFAYYSLNSLQCGFWATIFYFCSPSLPPTLRFNLILFMLLVVLSGFPAWWWIVESIFRNPCKLESAESTLALTELPSPHLNSVPEEEPEEEDFTDEHSGVDQAY